MSSSPSSATPTADGQPPSAGSRSRPVIDPRLLFLDGERREGRGEPMATLSPSTGEELTRFAAASREQVEAACAAARSSFDAGVWRDLPAAERAARLEAMATHLEGRAAELTELVIWDNGKTRPEAGIDVLAAANACRAAAHSCRDDREVTLAAERGVVRTVRREPVGVVAALTPFNAPLMFSALKAAPALAAGNSVVLKPSERAPLLPPVLCEAAAAASVPPGVLSLVQGGPDTAAALCADDRVDMLSLTGGVSSGTAVMRAAAPAIKNVLLELGGKSAHIVLADADLDAAIPAVAAGIFRNAGQRCFSGSRLLVEEAVAEEVERGVADLAEALVVGDPFEETTQVGAMIDAAAVEAAEAFVARAEAEGLRLVAGGKRPPGLAGSFYRPTVLLGASADSQAAQEEVFGPILTVIRVADAEEAVRVANATRYGLAGGVWTTDIERAEALARRIRCGYFWINTYGAMFGDVPFGGYGRSGLGREGGRWSYEAYTELKTVLLDTTGGTTTAFFEGTGPRETRNDRE